MEYCAGLDRSNGAKCAWYGFYTTPTKHDTRCEYCHDRLLESGLINEKTMFQLPSHSASINCDSIHDKRFACLEFKGFEFRVVTPDKKHPFVIYSKARDKLADGLMVVEMPEIAEYYIHIDNRPKPSYNVVGGLTDASRKGYQRTSDLAYTLDVKVGDQKVVINDGQVIYYQSETFVKGFETGIKSGFKFVANKPGVSAGHDNKDPMSNVITIQINEFKRIQKNPPPTYVYRNKIFEAGSGAMDCRFDTNDGVAESWGSAAPAAAASSSTTFHLDGSTSTTMRGMQLDVIVDKCETLESSAQLFQQSAKKSSMLDTISAAAASIFKGRTEQSDKYVAPVQVQKTQDTFEPLGGFCVTIQLIHVDRSAEIQARKSQKQKELEEKERQIKEQQAAQQATQQLLLIPDTELQDVLAVTKQVVVTEPAVPSTNPVKQADTDTATLADTANPVTALPTNPAEPPQTEDPLDDFVEV